jgi:hypothetical protein
MERRNAIVSPDNEAEPYLGLIIGEDKMDHIFDAPEASMISRTGHYIIQKRKSTP